MKRKIFLITLMVALFVCLFAISVSAADIPEWTDVITYETGENAIAYKDGFDTTSRVMLSNGDGTYSTYPTNYIIKGTDATFDEKEIDFTALMTASGNSTYTNASIIRIEIPAGFTSVAESAFRKDKGLKVTGLLTAKFPEGMTTFNSYTFYNNSTIVEVELPNSLSTWNGSSHFYKATALEKINFPTSLTSIPSNAFHTCTALKVIDISKCTSLTTIGELAFRSANLSETDLVIPENCTTIDAYAFKGTSVKSVVLPEKLVNVAAEVFKECTKITSVVSKAQKIGDSMFSSDTALVSLTIENAKYIGSNAFYKCPITSDIIIPEGCTFVGELAFRSAATTYVYLPSTLRSTEELPLGESVFKGCTSLKRVVSKSPVITNYMFNECLAIEYADLQNATTIGTYAFGTSSKNSSLAELYLYEGLVNIGEFAFNRSAITTLTIPSTVTTVSDSAFRTSTSLTTVYFLGSTMGNYMFRDCSKLSKLVVTDNLKTFGTETIANASSTFTTFYIGSNTAALQAIITDSRVASATLCDYVDYKQGQYNTSVKCLLVYNSNICDVVYNEVHLDATPNQEFTSYTASSYLVTACPRCLEESSRVEVAPIFNGFGYSARIENNGDTKRALVFSYFINTDSLDIYKSYNPEKTLSFGIVGAFESKITNADSEVYNPLNADGTAVQGNVVAYSITNEEIISIDFIIKGEQATWEANGIPSSPIYMLGYVIDDTGLYYIGNNTEKVASQSATITDLRTITYNELFTE